MLCCFEKLFYSRIMEEDIPVKKKSGRPKGSMKKELPQNQTIKMEVVPKKSGRPKGSKNISQLSSPKTSVQ